MFQLTHPVNLGLLTLVTLLWVLYFTRPFENMGGYEKLTNDCWKYLNWIITGVWLVFLILAIVYHNPLNYQP